MTNYVRKYTVAEAAKRAGLPPVEGADASRKSANGSDWAGGVSFEEALDLSRFGMPHQVAHLDQFKKVIASIRTAKRPQPNWDVAGSTVDIGRYLAGEPESMIDVIRGQRQTPMVRIAIERAVNAMVSPADIRATGSSVLAAIEAMRTAGIPAEIWATFTVSAGGSYYCTQVLVQESGRPVNLDVLAFWTLHPGAFRRLVFGLEEQEPKSIRDEFGFRSPGGGYGYASNVRSIDEDKFFDEIAPARATEALEWLKEVIQRRTGVEIRT